MQSSNELVIAKAGFTNCIQVKKSLNAGPTAAANPVAVENRPGADKLRGRCDSFVVETDVHFPTDINLLYDAIRKVIEESRALAEHYTVPGWHQHQHGLRQIKKQYRKIQKLKHSNAKDESKQAHHTYLDMAADWLEKSEHTLRQARLGGALAIEFAELETYQGYARLFLDQIDRRVIQGEKIPHEEKLFSIFQPHTEWISKGKAGVPVELGLRVCIMEDQHRFILPKKGRLNQADKDHEGCDDFKQLRKQHSGVESAINALEQNGLDRCPDHGIKGFKCYVALAVVSRNIKRLDAVIRQQTLEQEQRKRGSYKKAA